MLPRLGVRQAWLISGTDALRVRRIFSTVRYNVLAVIDSAAVATTVSNPGELLKLEVNDYRYA